MIDTEKDFFDWLDSMLDENIPNEVIAFNINIYESPSNLEIVGSNEFDPDDEDWACNEDWTPKKRMEPISARIFGSSWQEAETNVYNLAKQYLSSSSRNASKLETAKAFAIGFVDGNLKYVQ